MIFVHIDDIEVPTNRYRQEFDEKALNDLKESILSVGLVHPITGESNGSDAWVLRAGERRLRAIRAIYAEGGSFRCGKEQVPGHCVPLIEWNKLSEGERLEIEVRENIDRTDFTWQERIKATEDLRRLLELKHGKPPSAPQVAAELEGKSPSGTKITQVARAHIIAKHLDNPEVAKAKTEKEAFKIIERNAKAVHQAKLARTFDLTKSPHRLIHGDCLEILPTLSSGSFDVVLTDPPYGIDADDFGPQATTPHEYRDSRRQWEKIMSFLPDELSRVCKPQAHAYVFCDPRLFPRLETLMCLAGWKVFSTPLIWFKGNGMLPFPKHGPRRSYECILYAWRGEREVLAVKSDVIQIPAVEQKHHAAQKPVALYINLLKRSANPGDTVLDCFGGSGPILVAANRLNLTATYIEQDEGQYNIATTRSTVKEIDDGAEEDDGITISIE